VRAGVRRTTCARVTERSICCGDPAASASALARGTRSSVDKDRRESDLPRMGTTIRYSVQDRSLIFIPRVLASEYYGLIPINIRNLHAIGASASDVILPHFTRRCDISSLTFPFPFCLEDLYREETRNRLRRGSMAPARVALLLRPRVRLKVRDKNAKQEFNNRSV